MSRPARPDDVHRLRVPVEPRLAPDGRTVAFVVRTASPGGDAYRHAVWVAPTDGSGPARRVTMGPRHDRHPRFSPDGRVLAFLSDRRAFAEEEPARPADPKEREDLVQVHLLPLEGGEARRLTDLPRGVASFAWSPDGASIAILSTSRGATAEAEARRRNRPPKPGPGDPPLSDYRYIDRLGYQLNGAGFVDDEEEHLWLVEVATGAARPLATGPAPVSEPAWSPDGTRIAFATNPRSDRDIRWRSEIRVVELASGRVHVVAGGADAAFLHPCWAPDGRSLVALGDRHPRVGYRTGIHRFAADGSDAGPGGGTDLLAGSELKPDATTNSDVTVSEEARVAVTADGAVLFAAPVDGAGELWRLPLAGGRPERLTEGRHHLSGWDAVTVGGAVRLVAVRSAPTALPEVIAADLQPGAAAGPFRTCSALNAGLAAELALVEPVERRWTSDGREIQGWLVPAGPGRRPLVLEIHGGPHTLYGWSPMLEWQILAGAGISVLAANPRGSEGYGEAFNRANRGDWGPGPMADLLAGVDGAVADGIADPDRLGVTGGSYGGYLTNWIVAHTDRFRAALTCRSVSDMTSLMLTGDISSGEWPELEFGRTPWDDPAYFAAISPITHARRIRTPLLIQHAERDLRCTVGQAEALFTVLRSLRRQVRFMRVPDENHELTRSGAPFRRAEHLVQVRDWFVHYLLRGGRRLPPPPRNRTGR